MCFFFPKIIRIPNGVHVFTPFLSFLHARQTLPLRRANPLEALKKITSSHWQMGLELLKHHPPVFTTDLSHGTNCSQKPRVLLGCPRKLLKGYKVAYYPNISHLYLDLPKGASQGHSVKCLPRCRVCLQIWDTVLLGAVWIHQSRNGKKWCNLRRQFPTEGMWVGISGWK